MKRIVFGALALLLALLCGCGNGMTGESEEPSLTDAIGEAQLSEDAPRAEATFRRSTLYFISDEGFVVPVTKLVPWEEGIAKACISYMISDPVNDAAAQKMGLSTAIPRGTSFTLSISDGNALIDLIGLPEQESAKRELNMIEAIVNTLTEFPTVSTVTITREGMGGRLENGTELPVRHAAYPLNPEVSELAASTGAEAATLYFPNMSGAVFIPVTRYLSGNAGIYSTVSALIEGSSQKGLRSCFPKDTLLLGAAMENGRVTVNLSEDFKQVEEVYGLYSLAYRTLWLTLSERFAIDSLTIQVNGIEFAPEEVTPPKYANTAGER